MLVIHVLQEIHEGLDLTGGDEDEDFGIFSVKFSKDGKEIVVGNNERSIYVYDLATNKVSARIRAHKVCNHLINTIFFFLEKHRRTLSYLICIVIFVFHVRWEKINSRVWWPKNSIESIGSTL